MFYLTWYGTSMLRSIDSCQKRYLLTSVKWLYCRLRSTTHGGLVFNWSQVHFLQVEFRLLSAYGKSWVTREGHFLKHSSRALLLALAKSIYYCYCPTCIKHAMQSTNKHSPTGVQSLMRATDIVGVRQNPRNHLNLQKTKNQFSFRRQQRNPPSQVIVYFRRKYFISIITLQYYNILEN